MVSERHWVRDWVTSGQPYGAFHCEVQPDMPGIGYLLILNATLDVMTPSQIVSREFA